MKTTLAAITMGIASLATGSAMADPFIHGHIVVRPPSVTIQTSVPTAPAVVTVPAPATTTYVAPAQPAWVAPPVTATYVAPAAQPVYVAPAPAPVAVPAPAIGAGWRGPQAFAFRVRAEMNAIDAELRTEVQRGAVMPRALEIAAMERGRVEAMLSQCSADGVIAPYERVQVHGMVQNMSQLEHRFRVNRGFGGGFGFQGRFPR